MTKISLFGKGFVGSEYYNQLSSSTVVQDREDFVSKTNRILYGISTIHNYNIFDDPYLDIKTNLLLLMKVLENARLRFGNDIEINFISTWMVYGVTMLPAHENAQCNPKGFYSLTKKAAEDLLVSYCDTYNMEYRILRLANVLGPSDKKVSPKKNAIQWLIKEMILGNDIPLYYGGKFFRDYIDVRDCARAINLVMEKGNKNSIFNISNGNAIPFINIINDAMLVSESNSEIVDFKSTEFHEQVQVKSMYLGNDKLHALGYEPKYSIEDTIEWIVDEYRKHYK